VMFLPLPFFLLFGLYWVRDLMLRVVQPQPAELHHSDVNTS
jgi:hypothetical protein